MMILVEGIDGSGKSILVKQLYEKGYAIQKVLLHQKFNYRKAAEYCGQGDITLIEDRSPITDIVYRIFDNGIADREENIDDILYWINYFNVKVIYCKNNSSYKDAQIRGEDTIKNYADHEKVSTIYDTVMSIINRSYPNNIFEYDWHRHSIQDVIKFIEQE